MMIRSVAFTKEAYIGREVRIAARVSKDTTKSWSAKIYLFIRNGYGALILERGEPREKIEDAVKDVSTLLKSISKRIDGLSKEISKTLKDEGELASANLTSQVNNAVVELADGTTMSDNIRELSK